MSAVLAELGSRYAERWATVLVLPGLLFVAAAAAAHRLGHRHWWNIERLTDLPDPQSSIGNGGIQLWAILALAIPVLSALAAFAARAIAASLSRIWFQPWPHVLRGIEAPLRERRSRQWKAAQEVYTAARNDADTELSDENHDRLDDAAAERNAVSLGPPARATWMGDRLKNADARVWSWYRLDVVFAWPRLWLILSETEQSTLRAARDRLDAAVALSGWAVLYVLLGLWWWPALLAGAVVFVVGCRRTRTAVDTFAHLVEAAFDLRAADLAQAVGFTVPDGPLSPITGEQVTAHLRKHA